MGTQHPHLLLLWLVFGALVCVTVGNNTPIFFNLPARHTLNEDASVGQKIFTMFAFDFDSRRTPNGRIHYILTPIDHTDFKFSVDSARGDLYLVQKLDYEVKQSYTLIAEVADVGSPPKSARKHLYIDVRDVNDNSPNCRVTNLIGSLKEDAGIGASIGTMDCTDPDTGDGGIIDFEIVGGDTDVIQVSSSGETTLKRTLDYDTEKGTYEVDVKVKDRGTPPLFSMTKVILSLEDVDDNQPVFSQPGGYTGNIIENSPLGTTVLVLTASDEDAPNTDASRIHYGLESTPTPDWINVDPFSGAILVKGNIDWEQHQVIECDVYAHSSDRFPDRTIVHVTITVDDVNDGIPTFDQAYYEITLNESTLANITVAIINATDLDDGPDGQVSYSIEGASIFHIDESTGVLSLAEPADYEVRNSYLLTVVAKDGGNPATSSSVFVQVSVLPENEFSPVFVAPFTFDVSEDLAPGSSVFTLSTQDGDEGLDGLVGYQVVNNGVPFLIDSGTGVIRVAYDLDFETTTWYTMTIEAVDNSTTIRRSSQQTFIINILDANDVAAVCEYVPTQVIKYPFLIGPSILTVTCIDVDTEASGLRYNISTGNDGTFKVENNGTFSMVAPPLKSRYDLTVEVDDGGGQITSVSFTVFAETELTFRNLPDIVVVNESSSLATGPYETQPGYAFPPVVSEFLQGNEEHRLILRPGSGDIVFAMDFDRDTQENYTYTIEAVSVSGQNVTQTFTLHVEDINDNAPKFSSTAFRFKASENLPVESDIYRFSATDLDKEINAEISYSIPLGNDDGIFAINSTGILRIVAPLHYEAKSMHVLEIEASDSGIPSLTGTTTVVISVIDEKEDDPEIVSVSGRNEVVIPEDSVLGSAIFQLTLPVSKIPDAVTFNILSGNDGGFFGLASTSGKIYLAKMLDRERLSLFTFSLQMAAVNQNGSIVHGSMNITVGDVNDNYPRFSKTVYLMEIQHGTNPGTKVGEVYVTDADEGENANVNLHFIGGNTGSAFMFSGYNLITAIEMDYHSVKSYSLLVQAIDRGVPAMFSYSVVHVKVIPLASTPQFPSANEIVTVEESTRVGSHITDVDATALGASETDGSLKYEIKSGNSLNHFSIDVNSGVITLVKELDYETDISYTLKIDAIYTMDTSKRDEMTLVIVIENVNEYSPTFDQSSYHWTVSETESVNSTAGSIIIIDNDKGSFGDFTTTLSGNGDFQIVFDSTTGEVIIAQPLDYLRQNIYSLTAKAVDDGIPSKSSVASITIEITDENNHSPSFTQTNYTTQMYSLIPVGSEVFHVHATDLDTGSYGNVAYTIISDSSSGKFLLNSVTGILTTADQCDVTSYTIEIRAEDGGLPPKFATATVEVTVLAGYGENSAPVFTSGSTLDLTVNREAVPKFLLSTVAATDIDPGNLTYYISSGNEDGFFLLDEENGKLSTATWLTTAENSYSLVIKAYDGGKPTESASITVDIDINPPRTSSSTADYSFPVSEDVGSGHLIGRIQVDPGRTTSDYVIISGNHGNAFDIDKDISGEGLLKRQNSLDYEEFSLYSLQIQVLTDLGNYTKVVEVRVTDVNDEPPYFATPSITLPLAEHMPVGYTLTTISYEDDDFAEANKAVTFSLTNAGSNFLSIDQSGHLTLLISPDFETTPQFSATVTITQASFPPASLGVTVNVLDVEETQMVETPPASRPIFVSLELPHRVDQGFLVHTLTLDNFGIDSAASKRFISFDVAPPFTVDESTGEITVTKPESMKTDVSYFRWIVCRTPSQSVMALVRLDTFDRDKDMVIIEFGETLATVKANKQKFLNRAQAFFSDTERVGLSLIFEEVTSTSRRRLLSTSTNGALYVVRDETADDMSQVDTTKPFLSQSELLEKLQSLDDGTPISGLSNPSVLTVNRVLGYFPSDEEEVPFVATTAGIAMLALLALLIVGGAIVIYVCVKKHCWSDSKDIAIDPNRRFKHTTTTTIGGTSGLAGPDPPLKRNGTLLVSSGTRSYDNTINTRERKRKQGHPIIVKVNSDPGNKYDDETENVSQKLNSNHANVVKVNSDPGSSHGRENSTQRQNRVLSAKQKYTRKDSESYVTTTWTIGGEDNPSFSLSSENNSTKAPESEKKAKVGDFVEKQLTFLVPDSKPEPVAEPEEEEEQRPTTPPSPLSPTRHVTPTLAFPTADDPDGMETIVVPDPVNSRSGI